MIKLLVAAALIFGGGYACLVGVTENDAALAAGGIVAAFSGGLIVGREMSR